MDHIPGASPDTLSPFEWNPDATLLATMPAWLPVNRELPPTLNLRIVSRALGGRPEVLAAGGNNLVALRRRLSVPAQAPKSLVVELIPDHIDALLQLDRWLDETGSPSRLLAVGSATAHWADYIAERGRALHVAPAANPIVQLASVQPEQALHHLVPSMNELERQPLWEKRRVAVGYGCPPACELCPRKSDQGVARSLRSPAEVLDEIAIRASRFGVRDIEIVGAAWASEPGWAETFLEERIRRGLEIRLRLALTIDQLRESLADLLVPGGCRHLIVRSGLATSTVSSRVTRRLKELEGWGRILLLAAVSPQREDAEVAAVRISLAERSVRAAAVHVLFHMEIDQPMACTELGRLVDGAGQLGLHLGITQRRVPAILDWATRLRAALASA
jgi:hypothetical protein